LQEKLQSPPWETLLQHRARLRPTAPLPNALQARLSSHSPKLVLHIGSGGGAPTWPLSAWKETAQLLYQEFPQAIFLLTGNLSEEGRITSLMAEAPALPWVSLAGALSLSELIRLLAEADAVIAGSTGPLHIAAAVDTPTVGLFPATPATGPWRWRPLSPYSYILGGEKLCTACPKENCSCLAAISPSSVAQAVKVVLRSRTALSG
jgi:ADP-heptose:LPS heptosyltransferase